MTAPPPPTPLDLASIGARLEKRLQFEAACKELARAVEGGAIERGSSSLLLPIAKRAHTLLKTRHTSVGAWRAGLDLFNAVGEEAAAFAQDAKKFLHEEEDGGGGGGGGEGGGGGAGERERPPETLAEALYGREAAEEMRRQRAAAMPVMTDVGLVQAVAAPAVRPVAAVVEEAAGEEAAEGAEAGAAGGDALAEARRLLMEHLAAGGAAAAAEEEEDLQAALLASRLDELAEPPPTRPPASRCVLAALPTRTVAAGAAPSADDSSTCPICCERWRPGEVVQRLQPGCGHEFHRDCLAPWLGRRSNACPLCRAELPTDDPRYEAKKEREQEEREERKGAENAARGGEFIYV